MKASDREILDFEIADYDFIDSSEPATIANFATAALAIYYKAGETLVAVKVNGVMKTEPYKLDGELGVEIVLENYRAMIGNGDPF